MLTDLLTASTGSYRTPLFIPLPVQYYKFDGSFGKTLTSAGLGMNRVLFAARLRVSFKRDLSFCVPCFQVMTNPGDIASLYRQLSRFPSLTRADVGPVVTSQYGGKYSNIYTGEQVARLVLVR